MAWHRVRLTSIVKGQRARAAHCIWVPLWIVFFIAAVVSFLSFSDTLKASAAHSFFRSRLRAFGEWPDGGELRIAGKKGLKQWLLNSWLPALTDESARSVIIGGLRLSLWRGAPGCSSANLPAVATAMLPAAGEDAQCTLGVTTFSKDAYGPALISPDDVSSRPFRIRADSANMGYLAEAFSAVVRDSSGTGVPDTAAAQSALEALDGNGWIDRKSVVFDTGVLAVIPAIRRWALFSTRLESTEGGVFSGYIVSCTLPLEATMLSFADVIFVAGTIVITLLTFVYYSRMFKRGDGLASFASVAKFAKTLLSDTNSWWLVIGALLDVGLVVSLLVVLGVASRASSLASDFRSAASSAAAGSGLSPSLTDLGTLLLHSRAAAACDARGNVLGAASASAIFVTTRSLRLLSLSPRLGIVGAAFAASFSDVLHFAVMIGAVFGASVLFAYGAFGASVSQLADPATAAYTLLRTTVMFDIPFEAMLGENAQIASIFFALYMLVVTHALLWAWLGISLEAFSVVRGELRENAPRLPTFLEDVCAGFVTTTRWASACASAVRNRGVDLQTAATAHPWKKNAAIVKVLDSIDDALQSRAITSDYITADELGAALKSTRAAALRAATAISTFDDISQDFEDALLALSGTCESRPIIASEQPHDHTVDDGPVVESVHAAPSSTQRTVAVRGMLLRVTAPPPLEMTEVDTPRS